MSFLPIVTSIIIGGFIMYKIWQKLLVKYNKFPNLGHNLLSRSNFELKLPINLILCTDLDNTLFGKQNNELYLKKFNDLWINKYGNNNCILIYATGRSLKKYKLAVNEYKNLMKPDVLITCDGVMIHWLNKHLINIIFKNNDFDKVRINGETIYYIIYLYIIYYFI